MRNKTDTSSWKHNCKRKVSHKALAFFNVLTIHLSVSLVSVRCLFFRCVSSGKQRFVAAISCLKRALYLDPFEWIISYNLGLVHLATHQAASAFHYLSASINHKADFPASYCYLALALARLGDRENAIAAYEKCCTMDANELLYRLNYTITLVQFEMAAEAKLNFSIAQKLYSEMSLEQKNSDPEVKQQMAQLEAQLGKGHHT